MLIESHLTYNTDYKLNINFINLSTRTHPEYLLTACVLSLSGILYGPIINQHYDQPRYSRSL